MKSKIFIKKHLAMIKHTFLDKCNTIIKDSKYNTGLNPVAELNAGNMTSRILIHFNVDDIKRSIDCGEMNINDLTHILKMKNCGSVNLPIFNNEVENADTNKSRASSFDIIAFKIPKTDYPWDEGRGFNYNGDYIKEAHKYTTIEGSNWYQACGGLLWKEEGIYSRETLEKEYKEKFGLSDSFIITRQHFDSGIEDLELNLTSYVNDILLGKEENNGIALAFSPRYEKGSAYEPIPNVPEDATKMNTLTVSEIPVRKKDGYAYIKYNGTFYRWFDTREGNKFISFFTHHTNTFFHPYLETTNNNVIADDRAKFHLGQKNRLYFFASSDNGYFNLDEMPICTIEGVNYDVKQGGKGIYYIEITLKKGEVEPETILVDTWSNIIINGEKIDDIDMEFVVLPFEQKISLGKHNTIESYSLVPQITGINDKERIKIGNTREVKVDFIEEYTYGKKHIPSSAWYRIYVKEGKREITIYPYQPMDRKYDEHSFTIDTIELIPNEYHIDIMINYNGKARYFENCLEFEVISNISQYYI